MQRTSRATVGDQLEASFHHFSEEALRAGQLSEVDLYPSLAALAVGMPPIPGRKSPGAHSQRLYDDGELFDMGDPQTRRLLAAHSLSPGEALRLRVLGREGVILAVVDDDFATPAVLREATEEIRAHLRSETERLRGASRDSSTLNS